MKISVVIATYNGSRYIIEQLNSILNQTMIPNEILIFDDMSKDNTIDVVNDYIIANSIDNIKIYQNDRNLGYALNFWNALKKAQGDIIFLCDQDDIWMPDKVERMYKIFINNPKILTLNTAYELVDQNGNIIIDKTKLNLNLIKKVKRINFKAFIRSPRYPGMSMAVRRELVDMLKNIPDSYIYAHDWMLNQAAAKENGMYYYGMKLTKYRQHSNNTVGIISKSNKDMKIHRLETINDQFNLANVIEMLYSNEESIKRYISKFKKITKKRELYVRDGRIISECILFITNYRYMSLRSLLGDVYSIIIQK